MRITLLQPKILHTPYEPGFTTRYPVTEQTRRYLADATINRAGILRPVVGDLVLLHDGRLDRISYIRNYDGVFRWQGLRPEKKSIDFALQHGGFYIYRYGSSSYCGGLSDSRREVLEFKEMMLATFWFPESGDLRYNCATFAMIPTAVWEVK